MSIVFLESLVTSLLYAQQRRLVFLKGQLCRLLCFCVGGGTLTFD